MRETVGHRPPAPAVVREARDTDEARILEIGNALFPDYPETLDEFREFRARLQEGGYSSILVVAETPTGEVVGHSHAHHMPGQFDPARYRMGVYTDPDWQGRCIGSALYSHMRGVLTTRGALVIESFARETMPEAIRFLVHRGFRETMRTWEVRLDLGRFDPAPFVHYLEHARGEGVTIVTLEDELRRDPGALRRAYELHNAVVADIPMPIPYTPIPFEVYVRSTIESPRALPDAYFLALAGDDYVGEANLQRPAHGTHLYHGVTGVLPAHRGRGIAGALKLATIAYGRQHGYSEIRTWNEMHNTGMLAINERLGFTRQPAWITFEAALDSGAGP
ncbi:MAG: GNAT family N-acetyltransferase [bacterium]|nr:GNAT family N-acetyltransferase [bacterium]